MFSFALIRRLFNRTPPPPSYTTVDPSGGPGWYRWQRGRWRLVGGQKIAMGDIYLGEFDLMKFAVDALIEIHEASRGE